MKSGLKLIQQSINLASHYAKQRKAEKWDWIEETLVIDGHESTLIQWGVS